LTARPPVPIEEYRRSGPFLQAGGRARIRSAFIPTGFKGEKNDLKKRQTRVITLLPGATILQALVEKWAAAGQRAVTARVGDPFSIKVNGHRGFNWTEVLGEFTKAVQVQLNREPQNNLRQASGFPVEEGQSKTTEGGHAEEKKHRF